MAKRSSKSRKVENAKCPESVGVLVDINTWGSPGGAREWSGVVSGGLWWWPVVVVKSGCEKWCKVVLKSVPGRILLIGAGGRAGGEGETSWSAPPPV